MSTEQLRAEFEAWTGYSEEALSRNAGDGYCIKGVDNEWRAYQAGRAALQSQDQEDADLKEALLLALEYWADRQQRYKNRSPVWVQKARAALGIDHARRIEGCLT